MRTPDQRVTMEGMTMEQLLLTEDELEIVQITADTLGADRFELESVSPHPWGVHATFTIPHDSEIDGFGLVMCR